MFMGSVISRLLLTHRMIPEPFFGNSTPHQHNPQPSRIADEIAFREQRLANLGQAKAVLEARARERHELEQAKYEAKLRARERACLERSERKAQEKGRKPGGRLLRLVRAMTTSTTTPTRTRTS